MSKELFPKDSYEVYEPTLTAEAYIDDRLNGLSYYYSNEIDPVKDKVDNVIRLLPRLIGTLYNKGLLTKEEIMEMF